MLFTILRSLKNRGIFPFKHTDVEVVLFGFSWWFFFLPNALITDYWKGYKYTVIHVP